MDDKDRLKVVAFKKPDDDGVEDTVADFMTELAKFETELGRKFRHLIISASTDEGITMSRCAGSTPNAALMIMSLQDFLMTSREDLE